jgi:hypothetical protein
LNPTNSTGPRRYLDSTDGLYHRDVDCADDVALANSAAWDLRHYYNYNATAGSRFGPDAWGGVDVESWATNGTSDVTYGAGGNYWSQFDNEAFLENRCDVVDGTAPQSPVDVCDRPSGHCGEFHEIRTRVSLVAMGVHPDAFGMRVAGRTLRRRRRSRGNDRRRPSRSRSFLIAVAVRFVRSFARLLFPRVRRRRRLIPPPISPPHLLLPSPFSSAPPNSGRGLPHRGRREHDEADPA